MDKNRLRQEADRAEGEGRVREAVGLRLQLEDYGQAADLLLQLGDHAKAATFYDMAGQPQKALETLIAGNRYSQAAVLCRKSGDLRRAAELEGRALAIKGKFAEALPHFLEAGELALAGDALMQQGNAEEAARVYQQGESWIGAARAYSELGRLADAAAMLEKGGMYPKAAEAFLRVKQPLDAARCIHQAGESFNAGRLAIQSGDLDAALGYLQAIQPGTEHFDASVLLRGQVREKRGESLAAANAYETYLSGRSLDAKTAKMVAHTIRLYEKEGEGRRAWSLGARQRAAARAKSAEPVGDVLAAGSRFSKRIKLEARIAAGAAGTVYRAYDRAMKKRIAVKVLREGFMPTEQARAMFVEEAKTVAKLVHPNIVAVYDIDVGANPLCFSMEWVDGATLTDYVGERGGCLPHRDVVEIAQQLGDALNRAHREQIVHRDVKPDNAMITFDGVIKLADFGLARLLDGEREQGMTAGTPAFMSPEQIRNQRLSHLADVYSYACTLYGLYSGEAPFNDGDVLAHHCNSPRPDVRKVSPWLSAEIAAVLAKGMALTPTDRWGSCGKMAAALAKCPAGKKIPQLGPRPD